MKIEMDKIDIEAMVYGLKGIATNGQYLSILSRILIEASAKSVTLTATDLETTLRISGAANVCEEGVALPPGKEFVKAIDMLKDSEVIGIKTVKGKVVIIGKGKSSLKLSDTLPDDYPDVKIPDQVVYARIGRKDFLSLINKTVYAVDKNDSRPACTGIYIEESEDEIRCVATNGRKLAIARSSMEGNLNIPEQGIIIPVASAKRIVHLLTRYNTCETVDVGFDSGMAIVKAVSSSYNIILMIRLIDAKFVDYRKAIPGENCMSFITDRKALIDSLKVVKVIAKNDFSDNYPVLLAGDNNRLLLESQNNTGQVSSEIEFNSDSPEPFRFNINAAYLLEAVNAIDAENVCISCKADSVVSINGDGSSLNVIAMLRE